jgi:hypothetical protein
MNSIKRFLQDERATAEATSTVVMIAAAGALLAAGLIYWYQSGINPALNTAGDKVKGMTGSMKNSIP